MKTKSDNKMMRRRLAGAYLSSVVSISLVLLLIGAATLLVLNARKVSDYFKEKMQLSVILEMDVSDSLACRYASELRTLSWVAEADVITREQGARELEDMYGEEFLAFMDSPSIPVSISLTLQPDYVCADSIAVVTPVLERSPYVAEVDVQTSLIEAFTTNLGRITVVLCVLIALLLFISFVLIGNTVRLNVFARRFTIHTMKLVGAERSMIRRPFVGAAVWQGLASAVLAIVMMALILYFASRSLAPLIALLGRRELLVTAGVVLLGGVLICVVSTYFVVGRLISMPKDKLYY